MSTIIHGTVLKSVRRAGNFTPQGETESRSYDHDVLTIFDGEEVVEVKVRGEHRNLIQDVKPGVTVSLDVALPKGAKVVFVPSAVPAGK